MQPFPVGIMSSCSLLVFPFMVILVSSIYVASASQFPSETPNSPSSTQALSKLLKSTKVRSHGSSIRDVIIAHVMSGNTQTDTENAK